MASFVPTALALAALLSFAAAPQAPAERTPAQREATESAPTALSAAQDDFARVAILGASLSAGSGLRKWLGFEGDLAPLFATLVVRPGAIETFADVLFFADPEQRGNELIAEARAFDPTLVVALDFLFWYAHGWMADEHRAARLERGLELLSSFDCPLVIADFPDISLALEGSATPMGGGPLVTAPMLPSPEARAALNERLLAWVTERRAGGADVVVVPFGHYLELLQRAEPIEIGADRWPGGDRAALLQSDLLHPTLEGAYIVLLITAEAMVAQSARFDAAAFRPDRAALEAALPAASAPWREAWEAEQQARAEQRAREREERRRERKR